MAAAKLPLSKVTAALLKTTEALASELVSPTDEPPLWSEFEWRVAQAVAAMQGTAGLLCGAVRWRGSASWCHFIEQQRDFVRSRQHGISRLLEEIDAAARRAGIAFMALKGAALHAIGIYQAGERPMADIDLLVYRADENGMLRLLEGLGYSVTETIKRHHTLMPSNHKPPATWGDHADNAIKIELHTRIVELLPIRPVDVTPIVLSREMHAGLNPYPGPPALMAHLLLHAAGNMRTRVLRLIQLHDIAKLAKRFSAEDWEGLRSACRNETGLWWLAPPLIVTDRYYPGVIPPALLAQIESECPWLLARVSRRQGLMAVSWSNARIEAFPGIEWAATLREALRFAIGRIRPSQEALHGWEVFVEQNPRMAGVPWYEISHAGRMARWVLSRPPRMQTMRTIKAALDQSGCRNNPIR